MSQQISLFIDVQNKQLLRSDSSSIGTSLPDVFQGDTVGLYLEFLDTTQSPYQDIDYSVASVIAAIGTVAAPPTAGYLTITDPAASQTTANIAYNATASAVQSAIQAALTTNWSGATVTGNAGGPYTITNGANGSETALIGTSVSLTPTGLVSISTIQAGTGSLPQIQYVQVLQAPIALQDSWTPYPAPTATVSRLQAGSGSQNEVQQITLGNNPYSGAFLVNFGGKTSNPIQWNASPATVQGTLQAMSSIGSGNVSVGGSAGAWIVTFTGTLALASQSLMTTVASGLIGPVALTGTLSLSTAGIEEAMGDNDSISETFAIQVTPSGGSAFTAIQTGITITNDLIVGAPAAPTPSVSYFTEAESDARYLGISANAASASTAASAGGVNIQSFDFGNVTGVSGTSHVLLMSNGSGTSLDLSGNTGTFGGNAATATSADTATSATSAINADNAEAGAFSGNELIVIDGSGGVKGDNGTAVTSYVKTSYAVAAGTNTYTATVTPAPASYVTGYITTITFTNANTGAVTLNLNSLGAKAIQLNGAALTSGQIVASSTIQLVCDGTQFQIIT